MKTDVFQKLCLKFLVHLMAADQLELKDVRARMGNFSIKSGIPMEELENCMTKLLEMINNHYVLGEPIPVDEVDERFLLVIRQVLYYRLGEQGIQFRNFGSVIGKWRSHFKIDPEQSAEFSKTLLSKLIDAYVKAKPQN